MTISTRVAVRGNMDLTESNLLQRFANNGDEEAFAFLVQRYGPLVLGVCQRQLGDAHLAEDAFQATFLVLARRAGELDTSEPLGNWLYGVAVRTSRQMRTRRYTRDRHEQEAATLKLTPPSPPQPDCATVEPLLDSALDELPERLRKPLILCAIQGKTYEQAATELRLSHDTVRGRIAQARERLRERLARRGVAVPAAVLLTLLGGLGGAAISLESARLTAHAAAQWKAGAALLGPGAQNAMDAAGEVLRGLNFKAWGTGLGWGVAASIALTLAAVAIFTPPAQPVAAPVAPAAPVTASAAPNLPADAPRPIVLQANPPVQFDLGEGATNLLAVSDVSLQNATPLQAAQQLSKLYNVNILFSEAALEELEVPVTLELKGLTGIEVVEKLAKYTNTELTIEDGKVVLKLHKEPKDPATAAKLPPGVKDDF